MALIFCLRAWQQLKLELIKEKRNKAGQRGKERIKTVIKTIITIKPIKKAFLQNYIFLIFFNFFYTLLLPFLLYNLFLTGKYENAFFAEILISNRTNYSKRRGRFNTEPVLASKRNVFLLKLYPKVFFTQYIIVALKFTL
ncbi:hypothetical protein GGTG_12834 [Gaeumannomyces tritici R3-111a-1]|uniref:Uncharacterized protein n=1 Tax=Gaeumannomyces tritici (strain R3-111a-1) TaxID=644352 RepID=J3PH54_GAET3|nr:hypothetical protein GGTG_12834 [Gaeumannomyces tritici R3-111a-1]EJT69214.1 hypothetical protein GGTG_12834 [Gaeumannomyces tritici R3-111a-1]